jgi:hypothetical protein
MGTAHDNRCSKNCCIRYSILSHSARASVMISAVLVFNNNGQPRLTKFYTQLVWISYQHAESETDR